MADVGEHAEKRQSQVDEYAHREPGGRDCRDPFVVGPAPLALGSGASARKWRFAVKDIIDVADTRTGAGSVAFLAQAPVARHHAPVVSALLAAGGDLVGKTVTDEFAFSLEGTNPHYGTPLNPVDPARVPGGSSSGSAAAVASGQVEVALGTDTGGSVRVPASYCGIFGLRTSHGRISQAGIFAMAPSFDTVGPFARDPHDLREAWIALRDGAAAGTGTTRPRPVHRLVIVNDFLGRLAPGIRSDFATQMQSVGTRLGLPVSYRDAPSWMNLEELRHVFQTIQRHEVSQLRGSWYNANPSTFGSGVGARLAQAASVRPASYDDAHRRRLQFREQFEVWLGADTYLLQPAATGPAPPIRAGAELSRTIRPRTLELTAPVGSLARLPSACRWQALAAYQWGSASSA